MPVDNSLTQMVNEAPLKTIFLLCQTSPGTRNQQACKNFVCQNCELETWEWKKESYADAGRTFLQTHALTVKEVRRSSFTLPDKIANSHSAKVFQTTNHFRNFTCALTQLWKPATRISHEHPPLLQPDESATTQDPPFRMCPIQKPSKEALAIVSAEDWHHLDKRENTVGKYS